MLNQLDFMFTVMYSFKLYIVHQTNRKFSLFRVKDVFTYLEPNKKFIEDCSRAGAACATNGTFIKAISNHMT